MKSLLLLLPLFLLAFEPSTVPAVLAQNSDDLFQQALVAERVQGDLEKAISLFRRVVNTTEDRELSATALVRIGQNYERLGMDQARTTYERIVTEFGDQTSAVELARERLAAINPPPPENPILDLPHHHVIDIPDAMGEISPSGSLLSFVHWETGDYGLLDISTGETELISPDGSWDEDDWAFGDFSYWSRDGRYLLYLWIKAEEDVERSTPNGLEVRVYDTQTGTNHTLAEDADTGLKNAWGFSPRAWFPDGDAILAASTDRDDVHRILVRIDRESGSVERLIDQPGIGVARVSPDGRYVVYNLGRDHHKSHSDDTVVISRLDGSDAYEFGFGAGDLRFTADGGYLLYLSQNTEARVLKAVRLREGRPTGDVVTVADGLPADMDGMGLSDEGDYYYAVFMDDLHVYEQSFDSSTGHLHDNRRRLLPLDRDSQNSGSVSPDGRRVAVVLSSGEDRLAVFDLEDGHLREHELSYAGINRGHFSNTPAWTPDGEEILVVGRKDNSWQYLLVDADTGETREVLSDPMPGDGRLTYPSFTPDGSHILFSRGTELYRVSTGGGIARLIKTFDSPIRGISIHPDTGELALTIGDRVLVGPSPDDMKEAAIRPETEYNFSSWIGAWWMPSGRRLLMAENLYDDETETDGQQLVVHDLETGERTEIGTPRYGDDQFVGLRLHPAGDRISYRAGSRSTELWKIEGVEDALADL